jgi:hypothetical protein
MPITENHMKMNERINKQINSWNSDTIKFGLLTKLSAKSNKQMMPECMHLSTYSGQVHCIIKSDRMVRAVNKSRRFTVTKKLNITHTLFVDTLTNGRNFMNTPENHQDKERSVFHYHLSKIDQTIELYLFAKIQR